MKYLIVILIFIFTLAVFNHGLTKHEQNECLKWRNEPVVEWQLEQCIAVGVPLDPVNCLTCD